MPVVVIEAHGATYRLSSPYDDRVVAACRAHSGRWDSAAKVWTFATRGQAQGVAEQLRSDGLTVRAELDDPDVERLARRLRAAERELETLRRESRDELVDFLRTFGLPGYRALIKVTHPDRDGGSHDWTVRVNKAWDALGRSA